MNTGKTFAERLQEVAQTKGFLQKDIADAADATAPSVTNWIKNGIIPHDKTLTKLCTNLGIRKEWLLTGTGPRDLPPEVSFSRRPNRGAPEPASESKELRLARERVEILKLQIQEAELRKKLAELEGTPAPGVTKAGFNPKKESDKKVSLPSKKAH